MVYSLRLNIDDIDVGTSFKFFRKVDILFISFFLMDEEISQATQFSIKAYRGCWRVNKNSTRKLRDYKRGERCLFPTNNRCWRRAKAKYFLDRSYLTRRRVRKASKTKGTHCCWV